MLANRNTVFMTMLIAAIDVSLSRRTMTVTKNYRTLSIRSSYYNPSMVLRVLWALLASLGSALDTCVLPQIF